MGPHRHLDTAWPRSLGYFTDLRILAGFGARITARDAYWVIETPTNPGYYWGNFLLYRTAPGPESLAAWTEQFGREFAHAAEIRHRVFAWDVPDRGALEAFVAAGFEEQEGVVLVASDPVPPPRPCPDLEVRPLQTDAEWEAALRNQVLCRPEGFRAEDYEPFKRRQMRDYRALAEGGDGAWFGAYLGDRLVGDLGLFVFEGVGRYQSVGTHPEFRQRGVCGTLVHQAACHALRHMGAERLVIVAESDHQAARVYQSVGFRLQERVFGVCRRPVGPS